MSLSLYNSLTRSKQEFRAIAPPSVSLYSCGPTVYARQHLGNMRPYVFADVLKRTLEAQGQQVLHIINITDVGHLTDDRDAGEDKLERTARREQRPAWEIAAHFTRLFQEDLAKLCVRPPTTWAHATQHIPEQQALIERLESRGFTYRTRDGIYFDSSRAARLGQLSGLQHGEQRAQERVHGTSFKRLSSDFALWKFSPASEQRQMEWQSPWGVGFPGWHTECCAMAEKYLGRAIDIHTGGIDHVPVHHENELLQAEAAYGVQPWVQVWLHCEWVMFDGAKMAKRAGGAPNLDDVELAGLAPLAYRLLLLGAHYRSKLNFSWDSLRSASRSLSRLRQKTRELVERAKVPATSEGRTPGELEAFWQALLDDLNTPQALAALHRLLDRAAESPTASLEALEVMDGVLGLKLLASEPAYAVEPRARELMEARQRARAARDFARADELRRQLGALGYAVEDTNQGSRLRRGQR